MDTVGGGTSADEADTAGDAEPHHGEGAARAAPDARGGNGICRG